MIIEVVIISIVLFCALIMNLAAKPKFFGVITGACTFLAAVGGLSLYGIAFAQTLCNPPLAIVRTLFAVCRMYAGVNDLGSVSSAFILQIPGMMLLFWTVHFMAFYATASATISVVGAAALKKLRYYLQRYGKSILIYGVTKDTVELGRKLQENGQRGIIYIAPECDASLEVAINAMGGLFRCDNHALSPDLSFLKSVGSHKGNPELVIYALQDDVEKNAIYARDLLNILEQQNVNTDRISLIMKSNDDAPECALARTGSRYGYGNVRLITDISLAARLLMHEMPPYTKMDFDAEGRATTDFYAVIVGFGRVGSEALRYLVRNAQFEGSRFHAAVFTLHAEKENGFFCNSFPGIMDHYDIQFYEEDARSNAFYEYLKTNEKKIKYLVIATENEERDQEIWQNINLFLKRLGSNSAICRISTKNAMWCQAPQERASYLSVYDSDAIVTANCDKRAMELNYSYVLDSSKTQESAWIECDYFSRESSRAAADYVEAFAAMVHQKIDDITIENWQNLTAQQKENLGRTEHLRWCAFHYSMGFMPMTSTTIQTRGEAYRKEIESTGISSIRIGKDLISREHACLCSWEELDYVADLEAIYTGKRTDYKDMDIRNVMALPKILKAEKENV